MLSHVTPSRPGPRVFNAGHLVFNGVHGRTGAYVTPPLAPAQIARVARGHKLDDAELDELGAMLSRAHLHHRGPAEGIDPNDLAQTGWGVIFPLATADSETARRHAAIREALGPLFDLRRAQASMRSERYYRELIGRNDAYRPNETKQQFLARLGVGPGPADPERLPYYLLLVGSPEEIPYHMEYQLDIQYAVGRIHFDTLDEYASYARSVIDVETGRAAPSRRAVFFGAANPDDVATDLTRRFLIEPLAALAEREAATGWRVNSMTGEQATKARLAELLRDKPPGLLFTATHGVAFDAADRRQRHEQGALLCQDWKGPGTLVTRDMYFGGEDIPPQADLRGLIAFHFACFSAGTPKHDDFSREAFGKARSLAPSPFVARLPQRMLSLAGGGALAAVGHVDRAWGCSFVQPDPDDADSLFTRTSAFESAVKSLLRGHRLGHAVEYFNVRYAETAADLTERLQAIEIYGESCPEEELTRMWLEASDARNYAVIGDPAVRLPVACEPEEYDRTRPARIDPLEGAPGDEQGTLPWGPPRVCPPAEPVVGRSDLEQLTSECISRVRQLLSQTEMIEVRTLVHGRALSAQAPAGDEAGAARPAQVVALTRIGAGGDTEAHLPMFEGEFDERLWSAHTAMVAQARADRRELWRLLRTLLFGQLR